METEGRSGAFAECKSKQRNQQNTVGKTHPQGSQPKLAEIGVTFPIPNLGRRKLRGTHGKLSPTQICSQEETVEDCNQGEYVQPSIQQEIMKPLI